MLDYSIPVESKYIWERKRLLFKSTNNLEITWEKFRDNTTQKKDQLQFNIMNKY